MKISPYQNEQLNHFQLLEFCDNFHFHNYQNTFLNDLSQKVIPLIFGTVLRH